MLPCSSPFGGRRSAGRAARPPSRIPEDALTRCRTAVIRRQKTENSDNFTFLSLLIDNKANSRIIKV